MVKSPPRIDILPEHLIDQIKAGEVIERPGNLIKEILENAIDAGANKLELTLRNNGLDLISLKDNGHGMSFSDLPLAFSRHATSKISKFEDLYHLHSFGFRGEALASIASISKLQCISKTQKVDFPSELRIEGGHTLFHGERQTRTFEHGTELIIQDLFFNTPARLKFIQSQQSEKTFIKKLLYAFILSRPEIEFQIKFDDTDKDIFHRCDNHIDRIKDLFPKALNSVLHSEKFYENNELTLYLIPGSFKAPLKFQHIFINNRYILDKQLHRVMSNGLENAFSSDDFHYIAYFNLPPDSIDVNVHPNKTVVKVIEVSKVISLLTSTIKDLADRRDPSTGNTFPKNSSARPSQSSLLSETVNTTSLQQERHEYNMEGLFSPHNFQRLQREDLIWIGHVFIKNQNENWLAFSSQKLLEFYTKKKLTSPAVTIPLLVSEPFPSKDVTHEILQMLIQAGVEIEYLGANTLVVRGIPEWMNGFPLKQILQCLLHHTSFNQIDINPSDWSQTTWEEMLDFFSIDELFSKKIALELLPLLRDKLK